MADTKVASVADVPADSATGACDFNPCLTISTYAVRIEAGEILVDLP